MEDFDAFKDLRDELLEKQRKIRAKEYKQKRQLAETTERKRVENIWQKALYDASTVELNGNLNIAWQELGAISDRIYRFSEDFGAPLLGLRLVGVGLTSLPSEVGLHLKTLQSLSLANNQLTELPDTIVELTALRELNLLKNKIVRLPERIGLMCSLQYLLVTNNCIEKLPMTFGALNLLERVDLECNRIKVLPENLDNLLSCQSLVVNQNQLVRLPKCIGRMPSLTSLSCAHNEISYIPDEITMNANIKILRLSRNQLTRLPENLGDMKRLKELCIGYNQIRRLPGTFYKLSHLMTLRLEGNPDLDDPSGDIIAKGAVAVVEHFKLKFKDNETHRMKIIIQDMQNIFAQLVITTLSLSIMRYAYSIFTCAS